MDRKYREWQQKAELSPKKLRHTQDSNRTKIMTVSRSKRPSKSTPTAHHEGGAPFQWDGVQREKTLKYENADLAGCSQETARLTGRIPDDSSIPELDAV